LVAKFCENPLKWSKTHEAQFPIVGYLACQILDFSGSQIKVGHFFFIVEILTRFFRC
jgi:hypothetical protein